MGSRDESTPPIGLGINSRSLGQRAVNCDHCKASFYEHDNADVVLMTDQVANYDCCMVCFNYTGPGAIAVDRKTGLTRTTVRERIPPRTEAPPLDQAQMQSLLAFLQSAMNEAGPMHHYVSTDPVDVMDTPGGGDRELVDIQISAGASPDAVAAMMAHYGPMERAPPCESAATGSVGVPVGLAPEPSPSSTRCDACHHSTVPTAPVTSTPTLGMYDMEMLTEEAMMAVWRQSKE